MTASPPDRTALIDDLRVALSGNGIDLYIGDLLPDLLEAVEIHLAPVEAEVTRLRILIRLLNLSLSNDSDDPHMDSTYRFHVRRNGEPGVIRTFRLPTDMADAFRDDLQPPR